MEMDLFEVTTVKEIQEQYSITDYTLIDFSTGFDRCVYLLFSKEPPERIDGCFVNSKADTDYAAIMIAVDWNENTAVHTEFYDLGLQEMNYHFIRPLGADFLLIGSRCTYFSEKNFEKNGVVLSRDGMSKRTFCFGDGIEDVITTSDGRIITSYFDEGIFGNRGWSKPIGRPGLIVWNDEGNAVWENKRYEICDCYAMNMDSLGNLWFYYYTEFDLVKTDFKTDTVMHPDLEGCNGFAVSETQREILFQGGYGTDAFYRCALQKLRGQVSLAAKEKVSLKANGTEVHPQRYHFNGARLLFLTEDAILRGYYYLGSSRTAF